MPRALCVKRFSVLSGIGRMNRICRPSIVKAISARSADHPDMNCAAP